MTAPDPLPGWLLFGPHAYIGRRMVWVCVGREEWPAGWVTAYGSYGWQTGREDRWGVEIVSPGERWTPIRVADGARDR